jgi:pimeloyl-ACP methyl ester carboxylesterase
MDEYERGQPERTGTFTFRGHEVFYRREGAGAPMVFLHNGGTSHRTWEPLLERYAADHDVIAPDMLGFGRSERPQIEYSLEVYVDMLGALLDTLGIAKVVLVGNCMGAATVLRYAAQHPERVEAIVAVNVLTAQTAAGGALRPLLWITRRSRRAAHALAALSARIPTPRAIAAAIARKMLFTEPGRVSTELLDHLADANRDPDQLRVLLSLADHADSFAGLDRKLDGVPVCVIWGQDNKVLQAHDGAQFCSALQPDHEVVIPNAGHLVILERPEEVATVIGAFLAEHARAPIRAFPAA